MGLVPDWNSHPVGAQPSHALPLAPSSKAKIRNIERSLQLRAALGMGR